MISKTSAATPDRAAKTARDDSSSAVELPAWGMPSFAPVQQMTEVSIKALNEIVQLSSRQLQAQATLLKHLRECNTINELLDEQLRFFQNVTEDCTRTFIGVIERSAAALPNGLAAAKPSDSGTA